MMIHKQACAVCFNDILDDYYCVNPEGGYGRPEVLICLTCLHKPESKVFYERLLELNVLEQRDII